MKHASLYLAALILTLLAVISLPSASAQAASSVTYSAEYAFRSQCDYQRDPSSGAITKAPWQVYYSQTGSDGTTRPSPVQMLQVDLVAHSADTVTVGQTVLTVGQILQGLQIFLATQRAAQIAAIPSGP